MDRKVVTKIISGETRGRLAVTELLKADDGTSAVECLRSEMAAGRKVDFVLMDFVMASLLVVITTSMNAVQYEHGNGDR